MNKMNNKGFTLVELLAVVAILGLIIVVVATNGFGAFDRSKDKLGQLNKDAIEEAANVLAVDIDNCDDEIDEDLLESTSDLFGVDYTSCADLQAAFSTGLNVKYEGLKKTGYISGSSLEGIENDEEINITMKQENGKVTIDTNYVEYTEDYTKTTITFYINNNGDDNNDGRTLDKAVKTIDKVLELSNSISGKDVIIKIGSNYDIRNISLPENITFKSVDGNEYKLIYNFDYVDEARSVKLVKGSYILEVWGAEGGTYSRSGSAGGKGGYSYGTIQLTNDKTLYIYTGGKPSAKEAGYNGGSSTTSYGGGGGGATDIRISSNNLLARVIVAGGGGGPGYGIVGGFGGGINGGDGATGSKVGGSGGKSNTGGVGYNNTGIGTFGSGGVYNIAGGGAGGGWYGGGHGYSGGIDSAGGGGSGYVYTESTASSCPSGCLLDRSYYLIDAETIAGNTSFPSPSGGTEIGHSGNGYARISMIVK